MACTLHFIFVIKKEDYHKRQPEFEYIQRMAQFYKTWIKEKSGLDYKILCDIMLTTPRSILRRLDTHDLLRDHEQRGKDTYHFYLTHFRPFWTDCTCDGYHAENFAMVMWHQPPSTTPMPVNQPGNTDNDNHDNHDNHNNNDDDNSDMYLFLAEKNCTVVSHEILHELLRLSGRKRFIQDVHDVWTRHFYDQLEFEQYGGDHTRTDTKPMFLTMGTSQLGLMPSATAKADDAS